MNVFSKISLPFCAMCLLGFSACNGSDEVKFNPTGHANQQGSSSANGDSSAGIGTSDAKFGSGNIQGSDLSDNNVVDYPSTDFFGLGNLRSIEDSNPLQVENNQQITADRVVSNTTRFSSSDSQIDKRVRKLVGRTVYTRVSRDDLVNLENGAQKFRNEPFLMYTKNIVTNNQKGSSTVTFNQPIPFLIIPTDMRRYDSLSSNPARYNFTAQGSKNFSGTVSLQIVSRTDPQIKIRMTVDIPQDKLGELYDAMPIPQSTTYQIDTVKKKVLSIETYTYYFNDVINQRRDMTLMMQLCRYTLKGQSETFPCQRR